MKGMTMNKVAAILGGSPELPEHLNKILELEKDIALFGINHHASKLIDCDFIVFSDLKLTNEPSNRKRIPAEFDVHDFIKPLKGKRICQHNTFSDVNITELPKVGNSAMIGVLAAQMLGFNKIYIAGCNCYQSTKLYFHQGKNEKNFRDAPDLGEYLQRWDFTFNFISNDTEIISLNKNIQKTYVKNIKKRGLENHGIKSNN